MTTNLKFLLISFFLIITSIFAGSRTNIDVNADHNILTSTAETINKDELALNNYELAFVGLSYGITDNLQLTITTLLPLMKQLPFMGLASIKYKIIDNENIAFSIQPSVGIVNVDESLTSSAGFNIIFDIILNKDNVITLSQTTQIPLSGKHEDISMFGYDYEAKDLFFTMTAALSSRVGDNVKLIIELMAGADYSSDGGVKMLDDIMLVNYGVRFFNKNLAATLSLLKPITSNKSNLILGIPAVAFSAKF